MGAPATAFRWFAWRVALVSAVFGLSGCVGVRYYAQAIHGQAALLADRQPVRKLLRAPATNPQLAARLALALQAREFASQHLGLPDNRSYTRYVDLHRAYVVWNVFAAPRFSVAPVRHCFPIAGCVAYRGWFSEAAAEADAARLQRQGNDVWVGGVPAYSTLGWFADPILSSMLRWDDDELAGTIFHELAHQLVYVKGDTAFNESYAAFVQQEGLRQWRVARGLRAQDGAAAAMADGFTQLVLDLRDRLQKRYASGEDAEAMQAGKRQAIAAFRQRYAAWRDACWPRDHRYDAWVAQPINNARLVPFGLYDRWVPAFSRIYAEADGHWPAFYQRVRELARQPMAARDAALQSLLPATPVPACGKRLTEN